MSKLTVENVEKLGGTKQQSRRMSQIQRDGEGLMSGPNMRRMSRMLEPRASIQYGLSGRRPSHVSKSSLTTSFGQRPLFPAYKIQNTYRMTIDKEDKFNASRASATIKRVLDTYLDGEQYDTNLCNNLTRDLTERIKGRIKELGFSERYKYVCVVSMGENKNQGMVLASRCVWDTEKDNYATATYCKGNLFAVAEVFATYFE